MNDVIQIMKDTTKHSFDMFIKTDDHEYLGQAYAIEACIAALQGDKSRIEHMKTYVKREHRE